MGERISDDKLQKLITKIVTGIIAKDESFSPEDINENHNIMEYYEIDSLTFISKTMALEVFFDIDIDDGDLENLTNIRNIVDYILKTADEEILLAIKSDTDVNKALIDIDPYENNTSKQIRHIITSSYLSSLQSDLNLKVNSIYVLLNKLLRNNKVEHVSLVPKYKNDQLETVSIVFLTKKQLYYICLSYKKISVREISLAQLSIEAEYAFNDKGNITNIEMNCDVKDVDEHGKPKKYRYAVTEDFVDVTIKLLGKIHEYKDKYHEKH